MESAFAWIGNIAAWFGQWVPRWEIVRTTHGAIKFVWGKEIVVLGPGWHVYWPFSTDFVVYPTARQADNLSNQTMVTKPDAAHPDGKTILVGGMIVYEVHDLAALIAHTFDPDATIREIAAAAVHDVCASKTWNELQEGQQSGKLDTELKNEMKKGLSKFGVTVLRTTLTELSPCRALKLVSGS